MPSPRSRQAHVTNPGRANSKAPLHGGPWAVVGFVDGQPAFDMLLQPGRQYRVGRGSDMDCRLDDGSVSRLHGTLRLHEDGSLVFTDADSTNGTLRFLPGTRVDLLENAPCDVERGRSFQLQPGDVLGVGTPRCRMVVVARDAVMAPVEWQSLDSTLSTAGKRLERELKEAAAMGTSVVLMGNSGVGKTHAASRIHAMSRAKGAFLAVNAASLPADSVHLHARLLGQVPGAFTGATNTTQGELYDAHQGTFFLDEVESLPSEAQNFLLNVVEGRGNFRQLGSVKDRAPPKFQLVCASKVTLEASALRQDLVFRLAAGPRIKVPGLMERVEDIPGFMVAAAKERARERGFAGVVRFDDGAFRFAQEARWPGEVRQLRSTVEFAVAKVVMHAGDAACAVVGRAELEQAYARTVVLPQDLPPRDLARTGIFTVPAGLRKSRELTKADVENALAKADGNLAHASLALGIVVNTLKAKMRLFGLR